MTLFVFSHLYNVEHRLQIYPWNMSIIQKVDNSFGFSDNPEILANHSLQTVKRIQDLDLTEEEQCMAGALCIICAGMFINEMENFIHIQWCMYRPLSHIREDTSEFLLLNCHVSPISTQILML